MSRRKARVLALEALYAYESRKQPIPELLQFGWIEENKMQRIKEEELSFSRLMVAGTIENLKRIDTVIREHLQNWDFSRLKRVDLAVLRISTYSLMFQKDIHSSIVIEEAVALCMLYSTDDSFKFVNGVLDTIKNAL
ncbi:MAG: transcription antitermination factor NusB [Spirochaetaceae bacterium]|jgi:N utilization substance protein B|nr:transcription antitermination factor NusB [Spirochaetaceae bacterium]